MKISIVTVVRNSENEIEKTILSVLNQTYGDVEYIIIDGCSTDSTLNIVEKQHDLETVKDIKMNSALIIGKKVYKTSEF